jgi:uroporphyrin-III C-methyltransferase
MRINVGKQPKQHPVPQHEINAILVRLARSGRNVVRLKGGDPFIFGRGSEEALELQESGIAFSVIPGITSAQGAAAALNVPLTHRGIATGVRYVTGHCRDDMELDLDWPGLADPLTTLVIYMGLANIGEITARLLAAGRSPSTPVLAVASATLPAEDKIVSSLAMIGADLAAIKIEGPVLFVIGEVVNLHGLLSKQEVTADADVLAAALS